MARMSASSQDYLEAILHLSPKEEQVRSVDIAQRLGVSRASVSRALTLLQTLGYIEKKHYSTITITPLGRRAGLEVQTRHLALRRFLTDILGVDPLIAEEDACKMEHSLSQESLTKLLHFLKSHHQEQP
ncbi:MAG: metal-dependent transcriptional regulator [Symbiobacteriaceae bacterium]|nr:metal-dependent transcriptional regulator [Symbiobacteriaceae bacterium]